MISATQPPEMKLDADEIRLVLAYRTMDRRRKGEALDFAECQAGHHPDIKRPAAPSLRLIAGGVA